MACKVKSIHYLALYLAILDSEHYKEVPIYQTVLLVIRINGYRTLHWVACDLQLSPSQVVR